MRLFNLVLVAAVWLVSTQSSDANPLKTVDQDGAVCLEAGCVKAADEILQYVDDKVNPCDDFYRYSCGKWIDSHVIPDDKTDVSIVSELNDELDKKVLLLIEKEPEVGDPPIFTEMRNFYRSCMDTDHLEKLGSEPLLKMIEQLGGWPVLGDKSGWTDATKFDWIDQLIKFRRTGFSSKILFDFGVVVDQKNNTRHIVDIDQPIIGMPDRSYILKGPEDPDVAAYYKLMVDSAVKLGASQQDAEQQMMEVLLFETKLAEYSLPREERRDADELYNKMKLSELRQLTPKIDWTRILTGLLDDPITQDEEIIVNIPKLFQQLEQLFLEVDPKTMANYMMWRVVSSSIRQLDESWRNVAQSYISSLTGMTTQRPRSQYCLGSLSASFEIPIAALYVRNHFNTESKHQMQEMVDYIGGEFKRILAEVDWMDDKTREAAKEKADAMSTHIGYPDELLDDAKIEQYYSALGDMDPKSFFLNTVKLGKWTTDFSTGKLREPKVVDWSEKADVAVINAFYDSIDNSVTMPAGILQGVYFDHLRPNYLNFGAIGSVVGHEITHGFDDMGRQFDKNGNNYDWWDAQTSSTFDEKAQCIIEQYGNYTVPEIQMNINGINTQGENIADNGGWKEAFRAYERWVQDRGQEEPRLPGVQLNQRQLFWVSSAHVWCSKARPEAQKMAIMTGVHSPDQFRVNGVAANSKEFSETFNCPIGSPMNPEKKCSVW